MVDTAKPPKKKPRVGWADDVTPELVEEKPATPSSYSFPSDRSTLSHPNTDYSEILNINSLLDAWHVRGLITYPPFALELCSLFLRCLQSVRYRDRTSNSETLPPCIASRFFKGLLATCSWVYAVGYDVPMPQTESASQTLTSLQHKNPEKFSIGMEMAQLLIAVMNSCYPVELADIKNLPIGMWLDRMLDCAMICVGGKNGNGGLYLPFYIALRAIHPGVPDIQQVPCKYVPLSTKWLIYRLEPRLYQGQWLKVTTFPPADDGENYNLWYFYDSMRPDIPFLKCHLCRSQPEG